MHHESFDLAEVAERTMPAVVNISSTRAAPPNPMQGLPPLLEDPLFDYFFRQQPGAQAPGPELGPEENSLGSGVLISPDGLVLTNHHVIADSSDIRVTLNDGREMLAKSVGADPKSDLALIRLERLDGDRGKDLPYLRLGDSRALRLGEVVLAIGNPFGIGQTVTMGIVSAKGRADVGIIDYEDFIQTDAAINPGNSGGALINLAGELVGINTAIVTRSGGYQGVGFAIPTSMARPILDALLAHGKVDRGWLGIGIQEITPELAEAMKLPSTEGVLIADVVEGGPAAVAGLEPRDVVLRIDGTPVTSAGQLRNLVAARGSNKSVNLEVRRNGQTRALRAQLGEMPASAPEPVATPAAAPARLGGLNLVELEPALRARLEVPAEVSGPVVSGVANGSPAARAGFMPGDVIVELDRSRTSTVRALERVFARADEDTPALARVWREGNYLYLPLAKAG